MRILTFIEDEEVTRLPRLLSIWARDSQVSPCEDCLYCDPEYPIEAMRNEDGFPVTRARSFQGIQDWTKEHLPCGAQG